MITGYWYFFHSYSSTTFFIVFKSIGPCLYILISSYTLITLEASFPKASSSIIEYNILLNFSYTSLDFNKDGSIQGLDYVNNIVKSLVKISQEGNRVLVRQIFDNIVTERQFVKNDDNLLKLTFANINAM